VLEEALPTVPEPAPLHSRFVARLGGEEFLVVLPGLNIATATYVLQGMRNAVADHAWSSPIGSLPMTVSVGASAARPGDTPSSLLARADHHLYAAKAAGRNRVVGDGRSSEPRVGGSCRSTESGQRANRSGTETVIAPTMRSTQ
jgi:predicted signal transduction protein with EAL and GGDEF domain